ncbi:MAG TPA: hypothetical protein PLJ00_09725 [Chitinophagales bacterium]|nr:hypothetical protein [Chitinophagales bacterium]HRG28158.1 hypothetical protein [Chitinophagales bacterium]HRG86246.1 hypothetical protein [Chitinophagales bacterium]
MTDEQAVNITKDVFAFITTAKTISDLSQLPEHLSLISKHKLPINTYPKIEFSISEQEIQSLIKNEMLNKDHEFTSKINSSLTDPLTKLLYATVWKNGDLKKIKHIIKGILDGANHNSQQSEALVFYQFGKYLTKVPGQPIIDQHVIRAFGIYKATNLAEITKLRHMKIIDKNHIDIIEAYKVWLTSDAIQNELKNNVDYTYHIDNLLFATGKTIKQHN